MAGAPTQIANKDSLFLDLAHDARKQQTRGEEQAKYERWIGGVKDDRYKPGGLF